MVHLMYTANKERQENFESSTYIQFRKLTDSELTKKISELNQRLVWAHTNLSHGSAVGQILMLLDDYKSEQQRRDIERHQNLIKIKEKIGIR